MRERKSDYFNFGVNDTIPVPAPELVNELETMMSDKNIDEKYFHTLYDAKQYILAPYYRDLEIQNSMRIKNEEKKQKATATREAKKNGTYVKPTGNTPKEN